MKKKIVIVDDHILIANALGSIITNFEDFEVLYVCENGTELQKKNENRTLTRHYPFRYKHARNGRI